MRRRAGIESSRQDVSDAVTLLDRAIEHLGGSRSDGHGSCIVRSGDTRRRSGDAGALSIKLWMNEYSVLRRGHSIEDRHRGRFRVSRVERPSARPVVTYSGAVCLPVRCVTSAVTVAEKAVMISEIAPTDTAIRPPKTRYITENQMTEMTASPSVTPTIVI